MTPLSLLNELISIPSVNPMGRELEGPTIHEGRLSDFLEQVFADRGFECERIPASPGRDNVIARLSGRADLPTILLDAHQDTVPVDGMGIAPFQPLVCEGRIYGRGACDVKGGMAAMICAADRLRRESRGNHPTVVLSCTCDEEFQQLGAEDLVRLYSANDQRSRLLSSPPDMAIVAEPTGLHVAVAHRGATRWKLHTRGVAAHSSDPGRGENAIYRMAKVVSRLEVYASELTRQPPHPLCGTRTLSVGRILGGQSVNTVPTWCSIEIDRRTLPGEQPSEVIAELAAYLRQHTDVDFDMSPPTTIGMALADDHNAAWATRLIAASRSVISSRRIVGLPFGTHAPRFAASGVPTVVFGPGSIDQAHTIDEWLNIAQLQDATEILYRFLSEEVLSMSHRGTGR